MFVLKIQVSPPSVYVDAVPLVQIFATTFLRHIWSWMGLVPASKKILFNLLSSGCSCVLIPGGVQEMLFMEQDREVKIHMIVVLLMLRNDFDLEICFYLNKVFYICENIIDSLPCCQDC